ncbi:MAG: SDR family NAD(P)-dependent oxidoreductase, partial [Acetobacteraceae bacterium]
IGAALSHAATLLQPGGWLVLNEVTALQDYATLTFGLTDGWWAFEDGFGRIANAPLLDVAGWRRDLAAAGFPRMEAFGLPGEPPDHRSQAVIVAERSPAAQPVVASAMPAAPAPVRPIGAPVPMDADALTAAIAREVSTLLNMPLERLDRRGRFMDYGIDSILGGQVVARLNATLGLDLRPIVLFDHPSIEDLARHITREYGDRLRQLPPRPQAAPADAPLQGAAAPPQPGPVRSDAPLEALAHAGTPPPGVAAPAKTDRRIAVIGMAGRFADCPDITAFHQMLRDGRSGITDVPADRWSADAASLPDGVSSEARYLKWGGFLRDAADFDPLFFRISGREAELTDPQHRVFLTESWRALEDAGYAEAELDGRRCGVFVGAYGGDYTHRMTELGIVPEAFAFMGNAAAILSARIAYVLNLKGPCLAVDTACSSSLSAIHLACRSLLDGECDMALAGGVFLTTTMGFNTAAAKAGMLSPEGACKTFDADADGFVPGEGAGVVVLKPYAKALADGDHIEAVIVASAMNQDGKTNGITAPSADSQAALEIEVYEKAGIDPAVIGYVEAHGTGTKLGDPIEIEGLTRAFRRWTDRTGFCAIGSVKTNIGHAAHAAGIAGFLKAVLSLRHRTLFPSLHFRTENPVLRLAETPFTVNTVLRPWDTDGAPRLAAVSSFGFSGTNVHILLSEPEALPAPAGADGPCLVALSARTRAGLARRIAELRDWLGSHDARLADISRTLNAGRCHFEHRWAAVVDSVAALRAALTSAEPGGGVADATGGRAPGLLTAAEAYLRTGEVPDTAIQAQGRRISLPTYPFEMRRYWLDRAEGATPNGAAKATPPDAVMPAAGPRDAATIPAAAGSGMEALAVSATGLSAETAAGGGLARANYFTPAWQDAPLPAAALPGPIWLMADADGPGPALAALWRRQGHQVTQLGPQDLSGARDRFGVPAGVVILLSLAAGGDPAPALGRGEQATFRAVQALFADPVPVLHVHRGTPAQECLAALRRSARFDGAVVDLRVLRLDGLLPPPEHLADLIAREIAAPHAPETEAAVRDGFRQVRRMVPVTADAPVGAGAPVLRPNGHYLITGGGGVLAGVFARRLAAATGGRITLIGRSPASDAVRATLAACGPALYRQADVTDAAALSAAVAAARAAHGPIHGVIHAAGVPAVTSLRTSLWDAAAACLAPKIAGIVTLDRVLMDEPLDVFAVFSSLAGELGDFGQGAYAMGNAFCDRFAAWREVERAQGRRHGRSIALGWPLWREGRGVLSAEGERIYLATSGMPYLETEQGWQAFLDALAMGRPQVAVVPGDPARAQSLFTGAPSGSRSAPGAPAVAEPAVGRSALAARRDDQPALVRHDAVTLDAALSGHDAAVRERVLADLTALISRLMKIDADLLSPTAGLAEFGFDSIALKELSVRLGEHYAITVSPAVFFAHGTIDALADYLIETHPAEITDRHAAHTNAPAPASPAASTQAVTCAPTPVMAGEGPSSTMANAAARAAPATRPPTSEPIAIIGISGRFPRSPDLDAFWRHLESGTDLVGPLPEGRDLASQSGYDRDALLGGFLDRIDTFDAPFFRISPREACFLDPQHRLAIEAVWHCVEDAGLRMSTLAGRGVGVFFGPQVNEYGAIIPERDVARAQIALGNIATMLPNRISYLFDLRGPSEAIDTACSSSLVAVHRAVRALQAGECEMALAGGVSLVLTAESIVSTMELGVVSPDGRCHSFDARANGYVKGEGVGVVLLKPLSQAEADGDVIHAVILGSAENHGGHAHSLTAPNGTAQAALIATALRRAGVPSDTIGYVEAHGTGTELGDPVEVMALKEAFAATA